MSGEQPTLDQRIFQLDMELLRERIKAARPNLATTLIGEPPEGAEDEQEGQVLYLYGDVVEDGWEGWGGVFSPKMVRDFLAQADGSDVTIHINSPGGVAYSGSAIYNTLKSYKGNVTTVVDGFCASAASLIFLGGERRVMQLGTELMIHSPWVITAGNHAELRKSADRMENLTNIYAEVYAEESSQTKAEAVELMDEETYMDGEKAVELGYATEIGKTDPKADEEEAAVARMRARTNLMRELEVMRIQNIINH